jgi:uncharacterized protein (TIGR02217 family)
MFIEDPPFPACASFGFTSEPMYSVTPIERASGVETRNRNWSRPLHRYTATVGPRVEADIAEALEFWHAVGGTAYGFRFHDAVDYKSCRINETVSPLDQPLIVDPSISPEVYQLTKRYVLGSHYQSREIYKPIIGTIRIADAGVEKLEGTDWSLDYATGLVTLNFVPANSPGDLTWGGEFHVPVRFDSEFPVEIQNRRIQSVSFTLRELRRANAT